MGGRKSSKDGSATDQSRQSIKYSDAVEMAKWFLQRERFDDGLDLYDGRSEYQKGVAQIAPMILEHYSEYLNKNDPLHYDVMRHAFAQKILDGDPIPLDFRESAAAFLKDELNDSRRKAGVKTTSFLHSRIMWAVELLIHSGMIPTRNETSKPLSACDAVAEASRQLGLKPTTFASVKRIWLEKRWLAAVAREFDALSRHD